MDAASATRDHEDQDGPRLFLCYRRKDTRYVTGQIYRRLTQEFGQTNVFKDVDSIPLGHDFRRVLDERVGDCTVFLAVIGPDWLEAHDSSGRRALDDVNDFVRLEIEAALRREIAVIPVLVDDAVIPSAGTLPTTLADLSYRQGVPVRPDPDFDRDLDRLVKGIRLAVKDGQARAARQQQEIRRREAERLEQERRSGEEARVAEARQAEESRRAEEARRRVEDERVRRVAQAAAVTEDAQTSSAVEHVQASAPAEDAVKRPLSRVAWVAAGLVVLLVLLINMPWSSTPPPQSQTERQSEAGAKPQPSTVGPQTPAATPATMEAGPESSKDPGTPSPARTLRIPTFSREWSLGGPTESPTSIAVDAGGNVHVGLVNSRNIQVFDAGGRHLRTIVPKVEGGTGFVGALAVDSVGNTFVSWESPALETGSELQVILLLNPDGTTRHTWGGRTGGAYGRFNKVAGMALDSTRAVYVSDSWNHRIQVFDSDGKFVRTWGRRSAADGDFKGPRGLAVSPAGEVFVADTDNHRIQVFSRAGKFLRKWGSKGRADGQLNSPVDVAPTAEGVVYVADFGNHRIQAFDTDGNFLGKWGARGKGKGQFDFPACLAASGTDTVYVCDRDNSRIQVFSR